MIGEDELVAFYGTGDDELHLVFNFLLMRAERLTPAHIRTNQAARLAELPPSAWPCNTLGNHDTPRTWSRYGDGANNAALARLHVALMLTLIGTPFLYNGEEIGMANLELTALSELRDTIAINQYRVLTKRLGKLPEEALKTVTRATRDRCCSPIQWSGAPNSGFSPPGVQTWLPVNPNYTQGVNVADQQGDPGSLLSFYQQLLHLRQQTPALIAGRYIPLHEETSDYLAFLRQIDADPNNSAGQTCLIVLNFSARPQTACFDLPARYARRLFASGSDGGETDDLSELVVGPFGIYIGSLASL